MDRDKVSYVPLSGSNDHQEPRVPLAVPNSESGRDNWLWKPVHSCCFCFPLQTGIVVLAGMRALFRILMIGLYPPNSDDFQGYINFIHTSNSLLGSVVGIWAGCKRKTLAAKLFFWSWVTSLALTMISWTAWCYTTIDMEEVPVEAINLAIMINMCAQYIFVAIYFMKVSWSYYIVLKTRDTNASYGNGNGVELREIGE